MRYRLASLVLVSLATSTLAAEPLEPAPVVMKELRRIQAAALTGEAEAVRAQYTARATQRPGDPMPKVFLAWLELPSDDAWNHLKGVAAIYPDNPWAHLGMGRIYVKWKMKDQARTEAEVVLKRDPRFYPAWMLQAELKALQEDWAGAEALYRQVLAVEDDPEARAGLGLALLKLDRKEEALEQLKQATQAFPEQPAALQALVPLLVAARDPAAGDAAMRAVALRPKDRDARRLLADLRFEAGDLAAATREYEALVKLGGAEPKVLARLAELHRQAGAAADEDRVLGLLAAAEPKDADAPSRRAELALQRKDLPAAQAQLEEALKRSPDRADDLGKLTRVLLDQGHPVEALQAARRRLALDPAAAGAKAQVESLEAGFKLPRRPYKAGVQSVYWLLSQSLDKFYAERRAARPELAGKLRLKLHLGADGTVSSLEVLEDSLQDPLLLGHVYFTLRDATYQERKVDPVIDFELGKKK